MRRRLLIVLFALAGGMALWWATLRRPSTATEVRANTAQLADSPASSRPSRTEPAAKPEVPAVDTRPVAPPRTRPLVKPPLETIEGPEPGPGLTPVAVLENMRSAFRNYSARFGGNPIGSNREITASLNGGNRKQAVFLNPEEDGLRINERGELVDNWGTPFFFHQLSGTVMEIHSAGPDRKMWTSDDLVIK